MRDLQQDAKDAGLIFKRAVDAFFIQKLKSEEPLHREAWFPLNSVFDLMGDERSHVELLDRYWEVLMILQLHRYLDVELPSLRRPMISITRHMWESLPDAEFRKRLETSTMEDILENHQPMMDAWNAFRPAVYP